MRTTTKLQLLSDIEEIEKIIDSDCDWEYKYDRVFGYTKNIRVLLDELNILFDYYDPDTSYEEDVMAYIRALRSVKENLIKDPL
jgi:hypothetical protein